MQPVITWGRAWLQDNALDRRAKDVALVAALAHCDLAGLPPGSLLMPSPGQSRRPLQLQHRYNQQKNSRRLALPCLACAWHPVTHA